jgi:hypothetical protein
MYTSTYESLQVFTLEVVKHQVLKLIFIKNVTRNWQLFVIITIRTLYFYTCKIINLRIFNKPMFF